MKTLIIDKGNGRRRVCQDWSDEKSLTEQSHKSRVNINTIMAKYRKTKILPNVRQAKYGDFATGEDYFEAVNRISETQEKFQNLPANIRNKFNNNPADLIDYLRNPENLDDAVMTGLIPIPEGWVGPPKKEPLEEPIAPPVVPEPTV